MHSNTAIVVAGWIVVVPLGVVLLRQSFQAHINIDRGLMTDARQPILRAIGFTMLLASFAGTMFAVRFLITALAVPAIVGCCVSALSIVLLIRARHRIRKE